MNWNYQQPVEICFGSGKRHELKDALTSFGAQRAILVTSPSFVKRGIARQMQEECGEKIVAVFSRISPNPDVTECDACVAAIQNGGCDLVIALGGGSVLDCAKAAAAFCTGDLPASAYLGGTAPLPKQALPLIALPTTAGTGSETTCVTVLSDHAAGKKAPLSSPSFYPRLAIIDPELTLSVPPYITACTGMDVLCHAVEAYWSRHHQPICDALALKAARLVFDNLEKVCAGPGDLAAREQMAEASVIAGLAFTVPKTTSAHACSYPLTNRLGIPHGEACGLTIEHFLRINAEGPEGYRIRDFAHDLGFPGADALADAITRLKQTIGLRCDLKDLPIDEAMFAVLVRESKHPNLLNNPVEITEDMLVSVYKDLIG